MRSRIYKAVNMSDNLILKDIAIFLADYASLLLGCGATCIRIEKNTRRMADTFGVGFDITILPTHVYVSVGDGDASDASLAIRKTANCGISFRLNSTRYKCSVSHPWCTVYKCGQRHAIPSLFMCFQPVS